MRRPHRFFSGKAGPYAIILTLLPVLSLSRSALAQDDASVDRAYDLAAQGLSAYNKGNYSEALDHIAAAFAIVKLPALAVHMARANVRLGKLVAASELYQQALTLGDGIGDPEVQARARTEAASERKRLLSKIPRLSFRIEGPSTSKVSVEVDGIRVPVEKFDSGWLVDPGGHQVVAVYGNDRREQLAYLREGESPEIRLVFAQPGVAEYRAPPRANVPSGSTGTVSKITWLSYGVGGTGLLVSGVTALAGFSNKHHADDTGCAAQPRSPNCDEGAVSRYSAYRTISTVGFYTGLVGIVTGTALYFGAPREKNSRDAKRHVLPWLGLESAGIEGSF